MLLGVPKKWINEAKKLRVGDILTSENNEVVMNIGWSAYYGKFPENQTWAMVYRGHCPITEQHLEYIYEEYGLDNPPIPPLNIEDYMWCTKKVMSSF